MKPKRPMPPLHLRDEGFRFEPAPELAAFLLDAFVKEGARFHRTEYEHLCDARIGVLWTNLERVKNGLRTLGRAELYRDSGDRWTQGRMAQQTLEWFADWWPDADEPVPHFVLLFNAPYLAAANDASACALFAHELRHCGQKLDRYGEPKQDRFGNVEYALVGHDIEEFVSVVEDFGIAAAGPAAVRFVEAAKRKPRFTASEIAGVCGCGAKLQAAA